MGFSLKNVVSWGRTSKEYVAMFALSPKDLEKPILGCSDGPASFNHTLTRLGGCVTSVDPLYAFDGGQLERRIDETSPLVVAQTYQNVYEFVWRSFVSAEQLIDARLQAMKLFLTDYEAGRAERRYLEGSLPALPFADGTFELALCSHFLFLYSQHFSVDFHIKAVEELSRVASEVRVFPLLELGSRPSRHLDTVVNELKDSGYVVTLKPVDYKVQKGGNKMLVVTAT